MISFQRTFDMGLVREIMTHPKVWPWISDDGSPEPETFEPASHPAVWYVLAFDGDELLGLWMFVPSNSICWDVHTCLLPGHGYHRSREAAREMSRWIWNRTNCRRITTTVPAFNRIALRFAEAAGMQQFGTNQKSYLHNGKLYDQILLGLSPE